MFSEVLGRWLSVSVSPTEAGLSVYFSDITGRRAAEEERRAFVRDVLSSVTQGRLRLCEGAAELPARLPPVGDAVALSKESLRALRLRAEGAAQALGLGKERVDDLVTAAGEAAMNAVVHAGGGTGTVGADPDTGTVQIWVEDQGAGIEMSRLPRATLERGWTTAPGNFGHGFWLILQTIDRVWLLTGPAGTTVVLEQGREAPRPGWMAGA
jgi:anti-sigma regulatory factor (Ser/Thr protein kinase)